MGRKLIRAYGNPTVADSYDPDWADGIRMNCSNYNVGNDLPLNPALGVQLYRAVTCNNNDPSQTAPDGESVYQLVGRSTIRLVPAAELGRNCTLGWKSPIELRNWGPLYNAEALDSNCAIEIRNTDKGDSTGPMTYVKWYP